MNWRVASEKQVLLLTSISRANKGVLAFHIIGLPTFKLSIIISFEFLTTLYLVAILFLYIDRQYIPFCVVQHCGHDSLALWWFIMHTYQSPTHCAAFYVAYNLEFLKICLNVLWFTSIASFWYVLIDHLDEAINTLSHIYMILPDFLSFITL